MTILKRTQNCITSLAAHIRLENNIFNIAGAVVMRTFPLSEKEVHRDNRRLVMLIIVSRTTPLMNNIFPLSADFGGSIV